MSVERPTKRHKTERLDHRYDLEPNERQTKNESPLPKIAPDISARKSEKAPRGSRYSPQLSETDLGSAERLEAAAETLKAAAEGFRYAAAEALSAA